jgi:hypothetical protein
VIAHARNDVVRSAKKALPSDRRTFMRMKATIMAIAVAAGTLIGMTATVAPASASSYSKFCNYWDGDLSRGPAVCAEVDGTVVLLDSYSAYDTSWVWTSNATLQDAAGYCLDNIGDGQVAMEGCNGATRWGETNGRMTDGGELYEYDNGGVCLEGYQSVGAEMTTGSCTAKYAGEYWGFQ